MTDYLLGLVTLPEVALLLFVAHTAFHRSSHTRQWCDCGRFDINPHALWLPWWAPGLLYRIHVLGHHRHDLTVGSSTTTTKEI